MRYLAIAFAGLLLLAGCISTTEPAGDAADDVGDDETLAIETVNRTHNGTINGAGTPIGGVNDGGSDSTQLIEVEPNATKVAIDATIDAPPETRVRVGFMCEENDQGAIVCEESKVATPDSGVSWATENQTEDFHIAFFWDAGAGEADWTARVTQHVQRTV